MTASDTTAVIPAAADESPPVRIPIAPCSSMLLRTPSASSAPNPLSGTVAPDDANPMIFSYIPVGLSVGIGKFWKFIFCYETVAGLKRKNENRFVKFYHASRFIFLFF